MAGMKKIVRLARLNFSWTAYFRALRETRILTTLLFDRVPTKDPPLTFKRVSRGQAYLSKEFLDWWRFYFPIFHIPVTRPPSSVGVPAFHGNTLWPLWFPSLPCPALTLPLGFASPKFGFTSMEVEPPLGVNHLLMRCKISYPGCVWDKWGPY